MIKTIETDIGTYYFDSVNFTLSLSPISKQSSPTLDSVEDGVLKKVVINISNSCNLSCSYCYAILSIIMCKHSSRVEEC